MWKQRNSKLSITVKNMSGKLYLTATPIGNLGDISQRCASTLESVDFIAAEDTRNSLKLLNHLGIKKELVSYFEHNKAQRGGYILERLLSGESCALITDAGMPAISDPGEDLVHLCHENGVEVTVIPGPCAAVSALALSGLATSRFAFEGFLPSVSAQRKSALEKLKYEERTIIFYEAPHRLKKTLCDMYEILGNRNIALCKEITKIHETTVNTTLEKAKDMYGENEKGEFVLVVSGYVEDKNEYTDEDIVTLINEYVSGGDSVSAAVKKVSSLTGVPKNTVYRLANAQ